MTTTTKAAHTPGPWEQGVGIGEDTFVLSGGIPVAKAMDNCDTFEQTLANARLIAAAPDSHKANRLVVRALTEEYRIPADASDDWIYDTLGSSVDNAFVVTRAAIAKATGAA